MRPGHIRVFDGLRITTEHMNHLQGSFHSAIEDIREILGLGKVYYGFEVVTEGDNAVTVHPGLAFDFQKNRIVCEEPKTFEVTFDQEEAQKFVCIKYDQIEDCLVEGQPTRIWDSCSVVMRPKMPEPEEDLIPIAKLISLAEGDKAFDVISLLLAEKGEDSREEGREVLGSEEEVKEEIGNGEVMEEPETIFEEEGPGEPIEEESSDEGEEKYEEESEVQPLPESEVPAFKPGQWKFQVQQGVVRLAPDSGMGNNLSSLILEPLKDKSSACESSNEGTVLATLAEKEVALDFPFSSLTCHSIISGTLDLTEEGTTAEATEAEEETLIYKNLEFRSTAHGESTGTDDKVTQFGISKVQTRVISDSDRIPRWTSDLTEVGICHLPFSLFLNGVDNEVSGDNSDILKHLQLILRVNKADKERFKVTCNLLWKGGGNEEILKKIQTQKSGLNWEAVVAWKALGESQK